MSSEAPIISRYLRLRKQVLEPSESGVTFEGLIDALLVLYEECSHDKSKSKNELVAAFLAKFQAVVHSYHKLRVNIGDFQVKRVIGRGNFGDVKLAKEKSSGAVYALKVMKKVGDNTSAFFSEERDIMAKNNSPWLTKLDYAFQDSNFLYLAMEYHCGGDLLSLMDRHENILDEDSVRFYIAEVALGIHDLHKMGFVHRDIKPENILIDRTGHVKLADFGNAARLSTSGTVSKVMPVGTPDYIAPEVLQCLQGGHCKRDSHGAQCDYWSLGILAFEMFHGNTPFTDMDGSVINTYSNIMMHTNKVNFPTDRQASKDLKSVIESLLLPADKRLGHSQLVRHPFFSPLDWSNMLNMAPPYVPDVTGVEDDSHFDIIDDAPPEPDIASLKPKKEFKNLPFVGFTFTSDKENQIKSLEKGDSNTIENELKQKATELEKIKLKNFQLQQQALNHTRVTETSVRDFEQVEKLTAQLNIAEQDNAQLKSTIANVERILEIERQDRASTEQKTLQLLTDVRKKWARAEEERMEVVKSELVEEKEKCTDFENKYRESQSELRKYQSELEAVIQVKNQLKTKLKDYKQRLENVAALEEKRSKKIATLESEKVELNTTLQQAKSQLDESRSLDGKVDTLTLIIEQRDQIMKEKDAEIKIKTTELESFTVSQKKWRKTIQDLEEKFKCKSKECSKMQSELEMAKNETLVETDSQLGVQAQLKSEIKEILAENAELKSKCKEAETKKSEFKARVGNLEQENTKLTAKVETIKKDSKKEAKEQEAIYKEKMSGLEKVFDTLQQRIDELQSKRKVETEHENKKEVRDLETRLEKLEKEKVKVLREKNDLGADLEKCKIEVDKIKSEKVTLVADLKREQEKKPNEEESENFISLKAEHAKVQQELKEVKLDLRIEKRELDKKSSLVTYIREKETKNKENLEELEKEKSTLEKEIRELKCSVESAASDTENLKIKEEKLEKQTLELKKIKDEKSEMVIEIRKLKTDASTVEDKIDSLKKKIKHLETEREGFSSLKINNQALTEVSAELERQVIDYERINEKLESKIQKLEAEKRELESKLDKEKEETRKAKVAVNEEKSGKILVESKIKALKQRIDDAEKDLDEEKASREKHVGEYKALCKKLSDTLEELTKDNASKEQFGKLNERAKSFLEVENVQLKEELSEKTTQLYSHKESNFKLSQGIEEAIEKISQRNKQVEDLQMKMESEVRVASEKFMRHEATQAQQSKLIDFLQTKVAHLEGRKKTFADKIFGNKENRPAGNAVPVAYGDLEGMLEREKSKNKKLTSQLDRARAEVVALKTSHTEQGQLPKSMLAQLDSSTATHSHNIPHRLVSASNKKSVKCSVCQDTVGFMTMASSCRDCGVSVHQGCSSSLPNTCGLSSQLAALKTAQAVTTTSSITNRPLPPAPGPAGVKEGKVQTLLAGQWTDTYLVLSPSGVLDLYTSNEMNPSNRIDQLGLTLPHCRVSLQSSVSYGEVFYISSTDRPYTFKLSMHTLGKQEKAMYFMCQNFAGKVDWVNRLEEVIKSSPANLAPLDTREIAVSRQVVCSLPPPEEVMAVVRLGDLLVVGTTQGLAQVREGVVVKCEGINTPVHMMQHIKSLNLLVLATGGDGLASQLVTVNTRFVQSASGPLQLDSLPEVTKCHIFSCMETTQGKVYLCAANDHLVTIMEWSHKRGHFVLRNKFSTDQHTRTIHFTDHSVLVGTSKFYEIDLKNFSAEEFLDLSHPGIQKSVSSSEFHGSLPQCVMEMGEDKSDEREYALAFTRHILFVDSFGQEIRAPLVFEKLPVEHRLLGQVLVTTFCDGVQFTTLASSDVTTSPNILTCSSPHLVSRETSEKDLLYTCQDTASNNLMVVNMEDLELKI
eukprot:GFUD01044305.1.p1 GENE.GFUD01044305.1~~GFUD01044305.1.p1  ORF type:complete len:1862 (+),score=644.25 GFUD01044305.1:78-5663(+)